MSQESTAAEPTLCAETLGQIALIQSMVSHLPEKKSILRFVCRGLEAVPGTGRAFYRLDGEDEDASAAALPTHRKGAIHRFHLRRGRFEYGELLIDVSDPARFLPYQPYIENLSHMLAVIFEERRQRELNAAYRDQLEQRVEERTRELTREIQERRRAEAALQQIADATWEAIVIHEEGLLIYANEMFCTIFGREKADLIGKQLMPIIVAPRSRKEVGRRIAAGDVGPYEAYGLRGDGSEFPMEVRVRKLSYDGRGVRVAAIRDISEQKRQEELAVQSRKMEAIGTLAGGIAHDFNNILSIIIGNAELIKLGTDNHAGLDRYVHHIISASMRARELVSQILSFSRKSGHQLVPVTPHVVVKESLKLLRSTIPSSIRIVENIDTDSGVIMADPTQLHQLLINLFSNAVHAMDEKGTIEITWKRAVLAPEDIVPPFEIEPGPCYRLSISDTGTGMEQATLERAFDPFFTTKPVDVGTGMGLSIVMGTVKRHGGMVTVKSEPGAGTTFHLFFPIVERKAASQSPMAAPPQEGDERILLVDDEQMLLEIGGEMLQRQGYRVKAMDSSREALRLFQSAPDDFDLVITDQTMPLLSGTELAKTLLKIRPDLPIILCTGYSRKVSEETAAAMGIKGFCPKPLDRDTFLKTVRHVLDGG
jgi:PAS domain S-box-containing protein